MTASFSGSTRKKLLILDVVDSLIRSVASTKELWQDKDACEAIILKLKRWKDKCFFYLTKCKGSLELEAKAFEQYRRRTEMLRTCMTTYLGDPVNAYEFVAVCVELVTRMEEEIPIKRGLLDEKLGWVRLLEEIGNLYNEYDPKLIQITRINRGEEIATAMLRIITGG